MTHRMARDETLTISQVAQYVSAHVNTVRRWSNRGLLKEYRIGPRGDRRYRREDVIRFLIEQYGRLDLQLSLTKLERTPSVFR